MEENLKSDTFIGNTLKENIQEKSNKKKNLTVNGIVELPQDFYELKTKVNELTNIVEKLKNHTHDGSGAPPTF